MSETIQQKVLPNFISNMKLTAEKKNFLLDVSNDPAESFTQLCIEYRVDCRRKTFCWMPKTIQQKVLPNFISNTNLTARKKNFLLNVWNDSAESFT